MVESSELESYVVPMAPTRAPPIPFASIHSKLHLEALKSVPTMGTPQSLALVEKLGLVFPLYSQSW